MIRAEKASGARHDGRTELQVLLDFLRSGDTMLRLLHTPESRRASGLSRPSCSAWSMNSGFVDAGGLDESRRRKAFLDMLGVFAEFDRRRQGATGRDPPRDVLGAELSKPGDVQLNWVGL
jgi:hypothetical protein